MNSGYLKENSQYSIKINQDNWHSLNSDTITKLSTGTYNLSLMDDNNCEIPEVVSVTFTNPNPVSIENEQPTITNPSTCISSDGEISIKALGGTGGFTFEISPNIGTNSQDSNSCIFSRLSGGNYMVTIKNNNNCDISNPVVEALKNLKMELPINGLSASANMISPSECDEANGSATVSPSGGTPPFTYLWDNDETTAMADSLTEAIHTVTVTDAKDCKTEKTVTISGTLVPVISSQDTPALCSDSEGGGSLTLNITNVEEPYTISWDGLGFTTNTATNLAPGFYSGTLTDSVNCTYIFESLEVTAPDELRSNLSDYESPVCDNDNTGFLTVEAIGGTPNYTFKWTDFPNLGNTNTISNLYAGTYQLEITDDHDCVSLQTFDLFNTDNVNIEIVDSIFLCQGQTATIDAGNEGATFDWTSNNGFSASSQSVVLQDQGDYSVTVTNENGCTGQKEFHVKYDDRLFEVAFLISTESTIEDTLVLIEISWPVPDSVQWIIPNEFTRSVDGVSYKELIPSQTGDFTIGMKAFLGGCNGMVEKQITILSADSLPEQKDFSQVLIRKVNLFPNPNNGIFEIDIELATETNIQVDLYSMDGMRMQAPRIEKGLKNYNVKYNLMSLEPGFYFINVIAGKEVKKLKFIVN